MGIKGHAIFELTNTKTGEKRVYEDDNMVTNFLEQFCIPTGPLNYSLQSMLICGQHPDSYNNNSNLNMGIMSSFTGGLLLFEDEIDEDADNIWPRAGNKMTAQAGLVAHSGSNIRAGSYNGTESGPVENGYRHVWDFATNQGNGQISCACLTTAWGGILGAGTDKFHSDFTNIAYPFFSAKSTYTPQYQNGCTTEGPPVLIDYNKNCCYILKGVGSSRYSNPGGCLVFSWFLTKKITVRRCKLPLSELSIFQKSPQTVVEGDFEDLVFSMPQEVIDSVTDYDNTLTWSNLSRQYANINTAINTWGKHIYIYFGLTNASPSTLNNIRYINPGDDLVIVDIDTEAETCNAFKVKNTTGQSLTLWYDGSKWSDFSQCSGRAHVGSDGNYDDIGYCSTYNCNNAPIFVTDKYVIMHMSNGYIYRISRVDNTDVKAFTFEGDETETPVQFGDPQTKINYVNSFTPLGKNVEQFNKNKVLAARYEEKQMFLFDFDRAKVEWVLKNSNDESCWKGFVNILGTDLLVTNAKDAASDGGCTIYGATMPFMLTTINNLDTPVLKTAADTMKVTYIITNGDV